MIWLFFRRFSVFLLIAAICITAGAYWWDQIGGLLEKSRVQSKKKLEAEASLCYRLPEKDWLHFTLPPWTDQIKILSNAELDQDIQTAKNATHRYALSFEVIDDKGNIIQSGVYHHETEITSYRIPGKNQTTPLNHYADTPLKPADGKLIKLNLKPVIKQGNVSRLKVKLHSAEPVIKSAVVRVYSPEYHSGREISYLWDRLPQKTRQRLAEGNLDPTEFLSQREKYNLVRKLWIPEAPEGIQGRDYQLQRLYRLSTEEAIPEKDQPIAPQGLVVSQMQRATVPVPQKGQSLRFKIRRLDNSPPSQYKVGIRWYGKDIGQNREQTLTLTESTVEHTFDYQGGLIELWANARVNIQVYTVNEKSGEPSGKTTEKQLEPTEMYLRTYRANSRHPVVYTVNHSQGKNTPFRADFRILANKTKQPSARIDCELVNSSGKNTKKQFRITAPLSKYDRLPKQTRANFISKPVSRYFLLPENITHIRFSSPDAVLVSGYNRPLRLPKITRVPKDYYAKARHKEGQPTWFLLDPKNYRDLYLNHNSVLLTLQYHPPERDPRLLKGIYNWEAFRPTGEWSGVFLFVPRDAQQPLRKQALNSAYAPIPLNRSLNIRLQSPQPHKVIRPNLVYFTNDASGSPLHFYVNDRLQFTRAITGTRGRITLPAMPAGKNRIRVEAPPEIRVYMNHVISDRQYHMLRFANRIGDQDVSFEYRKQTAGEENLSLKLFSPYGDPEPSVFRVSLLPGTDRTIGPYEKLSILERKFIVEPQENDVKVPVLQSKTKFVTSGQTFFYPLGDDLPQGKYRVNIDLVSGPGGYVQMYRVIPGNYTEQRMKMEPILNHGTE